MTLDELFAHGRDFAQKQFDDAGELAPMWIGETASGERLPIVAPAVDSKEDLIDSIKTIFRKAGVVRYVNMVEGWMVAGTDTAEAQEALDHIKRGGSLKTLPSRKEVLFVMAEDVMEQRCGFFHILRDGTKPRLSRFEETPKGTMGEGTFCGLFDGQAGHA